MISVAVILLSLVPLAHAAEFINLNFDNPDLTGSLRPIYSEFPGGPFWGEASRLLRGWTFTANGQAVNEASFTPFGAPGASERTINLLEAPPAEWPTATGRYYLLFNSGVLPLGPEFRLSQTGTIPDGVGGIRVFGNGSWYMQINGETVGTELENQVLPVDIARFAGQTVKLDIVFPRGAIGRFDIYGFTQIPEPSTWALFGVGAAGMAWAIRRKKKS